jgi:hypothetical protein
VNLNKEKKIAEEISRRKSRTEEKGCFRLLAATPQATVKEDMLTTL